MEDQVTVIQTKDGWELWKNGLFVKRVASVDEVINGH